MGRWGSIANPEPTAVVGRILGLPGQVSCHFWSWGWSRLYPKEPDWGEVLFQGKLRDCYWKKRNRFRRQSLSYGH